jgi:hypothetical protein
MEIITNIGLTKANFPLIDVKLIYGKHTQLYSIIIDNTKHPLNPCIIQIDQSFSQINSVYAIVEFHRIMLKYSYDDINAKLNIFKQIDNCYYIVSELHMPQDNYPHLNYKLIYDSTLQRYYIFLGNNNQIIHLYPAFYNNSMYNAIKYFNDLINSKNFKSQLNNIIVN